MNRVEAGREKKVVSTNGVLAYSYHFVKEMVEIIMKTGYNAMVLHLQETEKVQ